jgi:hypothetical protein
MLPVGEVKIDPVEISDVGLGKSLYTKAQLDEFARFQDSQGTRKAYLAETAELAYVSRTPNGEWGLALSPAAQGSLIDMIFFVSLMLLVWGAFRLMVTVLIRVVVIVRYRGCGLWVLTAVWGTLFQLAVSPFSWVDSAMGGVGDRVGEMMEAEADREPEREKPKRRALSMEDLRKKYSWWPSGSSNSGEPIALIDMGAMSGAEDSARGVVKSTNL